MGKTQERIVAWLLTIVMVLTMAVGNGRITLAAPGDDSGTETEETTEGETAEAEATVEVTVYVQDSSSNPISGATVTASAENVDDITGTTGDAGNCTLALVSGTSYTITVSASGYEELSTTGNVFTEGSNVDVTLYQEASISGTVVDASDDPIEGISVTASADGEENLTGTTDSTGSYSFAGVTRGTTYTITASGTGYATTTKTVTAAEGSNSVEVITLNEVALTIALDSSGGTYTSGDTITAAVTAEGVNVTEDVEWDQSSEDGGTVDINGTTITAGDAGTVTLTAAYGVATASITLTISKKENDVSLSDETTSITKTYGDSATTYTVSGTGALSVTSDNTAVATVSVSGDTFTMTVVGAGSATLTVTRGGDSQTAEKSLEIPVTVNPRTLTVTVTAKTGKGSQLRVEVESVSGAVESDGNLKQYIDVKGSYTDSYGTVSYTLSWKNNTPSAYTTNYTFETSGTISTSGDRYSQSEVTVKVSEAGKIYDGTTTVDADSMVTFAAADSDGEAITITVTGEDDTETEVDISEYIIFSTIAFADENVGENITVKYTLAWAEGTPDSVTKLYSLPSGEQTSDVGTITAREVEISSISLVDRLYDGTAVVEIEADATKSNVKLKAEQDIDANDLGSQVEALYLTGTVNVDSADVGTRTAASFEEVELATDDSDVTASNFTLVAVDSDGETSDDLDGYFNENTVQVTISRAIIYLSFSDLTFTYDSVPDGIDAVGITCLSETETNTVVNVSITNYEFGSDTTDTLKEEAQSELQSYSEEWSLALTESTLDADGDVLTPGLDIGSYKNVIGLAGLTSTDSSLDVGTNYQIQVKNTSDFGSITVKQDDNTYDIDDISAAGSVYVTGNTLYVKSGATFTADQVVDSTAVIYDEVWIGTESNGSVTLETNLTEGAKIDDLVSAGSEEEVTLYLAKDGKNLSLGFTITLHNDGTVPSATFEISEETLDSQDFVSSVTFGVIDNKTVTVDLTVEDTESGIASIETYLYTGSKDEMDALDGQGDALGTLSADWSWEEAHGFANGAGSYTVSSAYTVKSSTYAVAFARVTDTVGNVSIYGSNGLVVEVYTPNVPTITYSTAKNYGDGVYNGNVSVTIQASEKLTSTEAIASGLQSVTYTIYKDGKAVDGYTDVELFDDTLESAIEDGTVTVTELQSSASMSLKKTITIPASVFNSNNVYVVVNVADQAGNTSKATGSTIQIDVTDPTVEVTYNNNNATNTRYFKKARKMTIVYTERNFDIKNVTFDLTLEDGTKRTLSFSELGDIEGISTSYTASKNDSQYGRSTTKYTDARTNTVTITFSGDNDYTIVPHFEDLAGNEPEEVTYDSSTATGTKTHFIIDTTAPTITITYYDADGNVITPGKSEKKRLYEDGTVRAVVTITEHNFAGSSKFVDGQITYTVTAVDADGKTVSVTDYQKAANTLSKWTQNTDVWTSTRFKFSTDANYVAGFTYTDLAGNSVTWKNDYYTVDKTAPTGTVTVGSLGTWSTFLSKITFGLFSQKSQKVKITADDVTTPVSSITYLTSTSRMTKTQLAASTAWKKYSSFSRSADRQFIVYAKLVDKAGNITYLSSDGVVLDTTEPAPVITITVNDAGDGIYSGDVPFTVEVTDPTSGGTYAGLQSVSYEILCDGEVTQSGNFDSELTPASSRVQSLTKNLTVDADKNNSNDVVIRVTAVDNAGNTATAEQELKIDITEPTITVTYNDITAANGTYYNNTRVATVTVTERNFDEAGVRFSITNTDGTQPTISGWSHSANSGVSDSATHTCTVTFSADGDYTFTVEATDLADNTGTYGQTDSFTVDQTVPVISVSYDNNDVTGGSYYKAARTATVTIREHNFDASAVTAAITASLNGQGITAPGISSFSNNGDVHTATISYTADGDYTFTISFTDMAGNEAADYETERFTVDTQKPEIVIDNVERANTGTVRPTVEVTDQNYEDTQVTITLTGANNGEIDFSASAASVSLGQIFTLADLAHEQEMDDIYTLKVTATDKAGNTSEDSYTFSVNRFGSVYTFDDATAALLESYYTSSPIDLIIEETNTNDLVERWIVCTRDGENYTLEEGVHYTVEESGGDGSWKTYKYTINKDNFAEDGVYVITMYSEDSAENTSSNQAKEKTIEFVVDTTSPSIVVTGISDRGQYTQDTQEITIDAQDNIYLASLRVDILGDDGEVLTYYEFTEDEITENYGTVAYELTSYSGWQTVRVTATDAAGNQYVSDDITVLINPSMLLQYYMNKPLFYGSLLLLLLLIILIAYYVNRKRKQAKAKAKA